MKNTRIFLKAVSLLLSGLVLFTSCASTTLIESTPDGAKVYINQEYVGKTPYTYKDSKAAGSRTPLELKKEGYKNLQTTLRRNEQADVGAIIAGIFFLIPFVWTMKYKPTHHYELEPSDDHQPDNNPGK